jgi:hypothetical protein
MSFKIPANYYYYYHHHHHHHLAVVKQVNKLIELNYYYQPTFQKRKVRLIRSPVCLCVPPLITFEQIGRFL